MDPRLYKELIENKPGMSSDGSGLGHITRPSPAPEPMHTMSNPMSGLTGAPTIPEVAPNFAPPPPFTTGSVLPHVSNSLGTTKPKMGGTAKKLGMSVLAVGLGYAAYRASKAIANRAFESAGDDVMPDLEDD